MEAIVSSVLDLIGFPEGDFLLLSSPDVPNVQATMAQNKKYILYNPLFVERYIKTNKITALKVLIAHEAAHLAIHATRLGETDMSKRIEMEYQADAYAATLLTQLNIPESEMLQVLMDLPDYQNSAYHPGKNDRIKKMQDVFAEVREEGMTRAYTEWPANYLLSPYMFNRWNLLTRKYNSEKMNIYVVGNKEIKIEYDITDVYRKKSPLMICLKEYRHSRGGVGSIHIDTVPKTNGRKGTIHWFYPEDKYSNRDIRTAQLSIMIYDARHIPTEPPVIKGVLWGVLGAGGVGLLANGVVMQLDARKDYRTYSKYRNPNEAIYTDLGTSRAMLFERAQKKNLESQLWMGGGAIISAVAVPALIKHIRKARRTDENRMRCGY